MVENTTSTAQTGDPRTVTLTINLADLLATPLPSATTAPAPVSVPAELPAAPTPTKEQPKGTMVPMLLTIGLAVLVIAVWNGRLALVTDRAPAGAATALPVPTAVPPLATAPPAEQRRPQNSIAPAQPVIEPVVVPIEPTAVPAPTDAPPAPTAVPIEAPAVAPPPDGAGVPAPVENDNTPHSSVGVPDPGQAAPDKQDTHSGETMAPPSSEGVPAPSRQLTTNSKPPTSSNDHVSSPQSRAPQFTLFGITQPDCHGSPGFGQHPCNGPYIGPQPN